MKQFLLILLVLGALFVSCTKKMDVIIDSPSIQISQTTIHEGVKVIIKIDPGESNVTFDVVYYWEDEEIGKSNKPPYQIEHVVKDVKPGYYFISCDISYSKKQEGQSSSGSFNSFAMVEVVK